METVETFWENVDRKGDDECWEWKAGRDSDGYGVSYWNRAEGFSRRAHRASYQLSIGVIPSGLCVLHECDNPPCCNPRHLRVGTQLENIQDRVRKRRSAFGDKNVARKNPERMPRGQRNGNGKLSDEMVVSLRNKRAAGSTFKELAVEFDISVNQAWRIVRGHRRADVGTGVERHECT